MINAGELVSHLVLDKRSWDKGMKAAKGDTKTFGSEISSLSGKIKGLAAGIGAFFLIREVKQTVQMVDSLAKLSTRLGESTEWLSEMQAAAANSGVTQEAFNMAIQRSIRRLSEYAATGGGEAAPAIERLGIKVHDSTGKMRKMEDMLPEIADSLNTISSDGERVALAFKLFDSEGVSMIQMLSKGSKGMEELRKHARSLGATISEGVAQQFEDASDRLGDFDVAWNALKRNLILYILPLITNLAEIFNNWLGDLVETVKMIRALNSELSVTQKLTYAWNMVKETFKSMLKGEPITTAAIIGAIKAYALQVDDMTRAITEFDKKEEEVGNKRKSRGAGGTLGIEDLLDKDDKGKDSVAEKLAVPVTGRLADIIAEYQRESLASWNDYFTQIGADTFKTFEELQTYMESISDENASILSQAKSNYEQLIAALDQMIAQKGLSMERLAEEAMESSNEKTRDMIKDNYDSMVSMTGDFASNVASFLASNERSWRGLGNILDAFFNSLFASILSQFGKMLASMIAKKALLKAGLSVAGAGLDIPVGIPKLAGGGVFSRPTLAVVGDALDGPERVLNPRETREWEAAHNVGNSINSASSIRRANIKTSGVTVVSNIPGVEFYNKVVGSQSIDTELRRAY